MKMKLVAALALLSACLAIPARAQSPHFTHMALAFTLTQGVKDPAVRLEILIAPETGGEPLGYLDLQGEGIAPQTTVQETVPSAGAGFSLAELKHQQIVVRIGGSVPASLKARFDAILYFEDGTQALISSGDFRVSLGAPHVLSLDYATVASGSVLGRMEKMGFHLLSHMGPSGESGSFRTFSPNSKPTFTHMDMALVTRGHGKPASARLEILVVGKDGGEPAGYVDIPNQEIAADSTVPEVVPAAGTSFTLPELKHQNIVIRITPTGPEPWTCGFDAILHFSDGTEALFSSDKLALSEGRREITIPLENATVASSSLFGRIERMGYKVLAHGGLKSTDAPASASAYGAPEAGAPGTSPYAYASVPTFMQMDVTLATHTGNTDPDTRLQFFIVPRSGSPSVGYLDIRGQPMAAGMVVPEVVPAVGTSFPLSDLAHHRIVVRATAPLPQHWACRFDAVLHFSDGSEALIDSGPLHFYGSDSQAEVSLSDASVAGSRSVLGGLKKFGFGILDKLTH